jgi:hypothetical protein
MAFCPERAVEAGYLLGILIYFLGAIPVAAYLIHHFTEALGVRFESVGLTLIQYSYELLAVYFAYILFTLLLRVPWLKRFITVTTPTYYYRRYHEPQTKLEDLQHKVNR